jgi:hypothetical protein
MNCNWKCVAVCVALVLGAAVSLSMVLWKQQKTADTVVVVEQPPFYLSTDGMVRDIHSKWALLSPQGQLWGFSPDQRIEIKVLEKRWGSDGVMDVYVNLLAEAAIPPHASQEAPMEQVATPATPETRGKEVEQKQMPAPVAVKLTGVAKLQYINLAGEWYLLGVEGVTLAVRPN